MGSSIKCWRMVLAACLVLAMALLLSCDGSGSGKGGVTGGYAVQYRPFWNLSLRGLRLTWLHPTTGATTSMYVPRSTYAIVHVKRLSNLYINAVVDITTPNGDTITQLETKYFGVRDELPYGPYKIRVYYDTWDVAGRIGDTRITMPSFTWEDVQSWGSGRGHWGRDTADQFTIYNSGSVTIKVMMLERAWEETSYSDDSTTFNVVALVD